MLVKDLNDQWICSCGNWVDRGFSWCPEYCEDWNVHGTDEQRGLGTAQSSLISE